MFGLKNKSEINLNMLDSKNIISNEILNELVKYLCIHKKNQINAGADVVHFDPWAGLLPKKISINIVTNQMLKLSTRNRKYQIFAFQRS